MISATSSSQGPGHHRRQHSTPVPFEAPTLARPPMAGIPPRRAHRRGQTVDYGSCTPQMASAGRRNAPKTVPELRDYFNAKSGFPRHVQSAQQDSSYSQQGQQSFIQSELPAPEDSYHTYQPSWPWSQEELQDLYQASASGSSSSCASSIAPALSRSASESSDKNSPLKTALHRMRQQQQQQQNLSMAQQARMTGYTRPMQPLSIQPEAVSPRMDHFSCKILCVTHRVVYELTVSRHFPFWNAPYP